MAEHTIETRILLRYDTYSNWMNSNVILKQGEAAIASFPYSNTIITSNDRPANTPPAIGIKIGDGFHYFRELPWVQAVAADVYAWAKDTVKPQYSAQEISGLQSFVENLITGDTNITIAPRIYQLIQGTENNANKYYLRYKENNEESNWIIDTSTYIDLSDLVALSNWIGNDINSYSTLGDRTEEHIQYDLGRLKVTDSEQSGYVVTSVSQTKGKVSTTKQKLSFSNINETLPVSKGGTGLTSLEQDCVLVGNGTSAVSLRPIEINLIDNNNLTTNHAIINYVREATAGLTGAMHFIGEATVEIRNGSVVNPRIEGYNFSTVQPGDVILYSAQEYVWSGGWILLGDEGSYAVKGSIVDADIAEGAFISQYKIADLTSDLNSKVDKIYGKQLSTNDYTTEEKEKLFNIENNAQRNIIEHIYVNGTEVIPTTVEGNPKSLSLRVSALTEEEEIKVASVELGAQVNKIEHIFLNEEELVIDTIKNLPKSVNISLTEFTEEEKTKLSGIEEGAQVNTIQTIYINGTEQIPNQQKQVRITIDEAALNLQVIKGARVPKNGLFEDVEITQDKKLELARIAKTGNIDDIVKTPYTYVILDCGSSTELVL